MSPLHPETEFHPSLWDMQGIGFVLPAAMVCFSLLGVVVDNALTRAAKSDDDRGLSLRYERFARSQEPTTVDVRLDAPASGGGTRELVLGREWFDDMRSVEITPAPREVRAEPASLRYRFALHGSRPLHVRIEAEPIEPGPMELSVGQTATAPIRVNQFVFP